MNLGDTVLFAQGRVPVPILSLAAGSNAAGFGVVLWSHTGTAYPFTPVAWNGPGGTGLQADPGGTMRVVSAAKAGSFGSTLAQVSADGSLIGVVIDSDDLLAGGSVPQGAMALIPEWTPAAPPVPFASPATQGLLLSADLQVPYVVAPQGGVGASVSQIVLYFSLHDKVGGRDLSYGLTVFDSRGTSTPYFAIDNGAGGTGSVIVTAPAGAASPYDVVVPGAAGFQAVPWSGFLTFAFLVTPATLLRAVDTANRRDPAARLSTNAADYSISNVSVDAEIAYSGQRNVLSYALRNFTVATVADAASVAVPPSQEVREVWAGAQAETIHAAAGTRYLVHGGSGTLSFIGDQGSSTVVGGIGTMMASAGAGNLTAFGGSGDTVLFGSGGDHLNAGSGSATLVGGGGDLLSAGSGSTTIFVAAGRNTITGGSASGSVVIIDTDGDDLIASAAGRQTVFLGSGHDTLFGTSGEGATSVVVVQRSDALLIGGKGHDEFWGGSGSATMIGGTGDTVMVGGTGNTVIVAGAGRNLIMAGHSHDTIFGGVTGDTIYTGPGGALVVLSQASMAGDVIALGSGNATVFGGGSADTYFLNRGAGGGEDVISGFRPGVDRLSLAGFDKAGVFAGLQQTEAGSRLALDDGTRITFVGASDLRGSIFV